MQYVVVIYSEPYNITIYKSASSTIIQGCALTMRKGQKIAFLIRSNLVVGEGRGEVISHVDRIATARDPLAPGGERGNIRGLHIIRFGQACCTHSGECTYLASS